MEIVGTDLFTKDNNDYLVMIDYWSKYIELVHLSSKTSNYVIAKIKAIFARWGIPEIVVSDNGPEFSSKEFKMFAESYDFKHVTSSPRYPQANGQAESAVKIAKSLLCHSDPNIALMNYRSTPTSATGYSPSQLLMGRNIRSTIPVHQKKLIPQWPKMSDVNENLNKRREQMTEHYNSKHGVKPLKPLYEGQRVLMKTDDERKWSNEGVIVKANTPARSYTVKTDNGNIRRNRRHIMPLPMNTDTAEEERSENRSTANKDNVGVQDNHQNAEPLNIRRSSRIITKPSRLIEEV